MWKTLRTEGSQPERKLAAEGKGNCKTVKKKKKKKKGKGIPLKPLRNPLKILLLLQQCKLYVLTSGV
jgi:predicted transcriptional regulator